MSLYAEYHRMLRMVHENTRVEQRRTTGGVKAPGAKPLGRRIEGLAIKLWAKLAINFGVEGALSSQGPG